MKTNPIFLLLVSVVILTSCGSRSGKRQSKSRVQNDSVSTAVLTVPVDSMRLVFVELQTRYQEFLKENKEFSLDLYANNIFSYHDSLGKEVRFEVFDFTPYAGIDINPNSYQVALEGESYVMRVFRGYGKDDSLLVRTPEELQRALLPFHFHMKEASISVLKLKMDHKKKLDEMVQTAL